ncbi:olfactory receptor 1f45-like [Pleurodeles waltl]|uniref:olfactory receptor 1f45-like n=1 Tax=Pleurodeles waltl TaxID=8319 RepID=UPI00370998D2
MKNRSHSTEFILLGLSDRLEHQKLLFIFFLFTYMITVLADATILILIKIDPQLHSPMFTFLSHFSFVDICVLTITVPKLLADLMSDRKSISFSACIIQLYFFLCIGNMEFFLLASMAYDRFVAICRPLHYTSMVNKRVCLKLVASSWVITSVHALLHTLMTSQLSFCGSNQIHHFFCDLPPLLKLSCSNTSTNELVIFTEGGLMLLGPFLFIIASYVGIISAILKIRSMEGRSKAFSTCSSHFTLVALFYGSVFFMYFRPSTSFTLDYDRVVSVIYTILIPMANPFIYSLRNKDIKRAFQKVIGRMNMSCRMSCRM